MERLQAVLGIRDPFIVENGAAIFFPDGYRGFRISAGVRVPPYTILRLGSNYVDIEALRPAA
ncbi:MAG: hypothetical protein MZV70_50115 [Desulfobacterales bacterium]|nr:hypothetical protein [Desulfobacterales bacterium]